jgi:hypothetical protein
MHVLTLLLFVFATASTAFPSDWSLGIIASPGVSAPGTGCNLPNSRRHFAYSFGVGGAYEIGRTIFFKAGLEYSTREILVATGIPDTRDALDPSTGRIEPSRVVYGDISEVYQSIAVPITINFRLLKGASIGLVALAGLDCGVLFRQKFIQEPSATGRSEHAESASGFISSLVIGGGMSFSASDHVTVSLLPQYSYSIFPKRYFGDVRFHTVALECAVFYRF